MRTSEDLARISLESGVIRAEACSMRRKQYNGV